MGLSPQTYEERAQAAVGGDGFRYGPAQFADFALVFGGIQGQAGDGYAIRAEIYPTGTTPAQAAAGSVEPIWWWRIDTDAGGNNSYSDSEGHVEGSYDASLEGEYIVSTTDPALPLMYQTPTTWPKGITIDGGASGHDDVAGGLLIRMPTVRWDGGVGYHPLMMDPVAFGPENLRDYTLMYDNNAFVELYFVPAGQGDALGFDLAAWQGAAVQWVQWNGNEWWNDNFNTPPAEYDVVCWVPDILGTEVDPITLVKGFAFPSDPIGIDWAVTGAEVFPGSDGGSNWIPPVDLPDSPVLVLNNIAYRISGRVGDGQANLAMGYGAAYAGGAQVRVVTVADVGEVFHIDANTMLIVERLGGGYAYIDFTDQYYSDSPYLAILQTIGANVTVTLDGDDLHATLDVAKTVSQEPAYDEAHETMWPRMTQFDLAAKDWAFGSGQYLPYVDDNFMSMSAGAYAVLDNKIFFGASAESYFGNAGGWWAYDPAGFSFSQYADPPFTTDGGFGGVIDGKFYFIQDLSDATSGYAAQPYYVYDPATDIWDEGTFLPLKRSGGSEAILHNGENYVGFDLDGHLVFVTRDQLVEFDPVAEEARVFAPLPIISNGGVRPMSWMVGSTLWVQGVHDLGTGSDYVNRLASLDPATREWSVWDLPSNGFAPNGGEAAGAVDGTSVWIGGVSEFDPTSSYLGNALRGVRTLATELPAVDDGLTVVNADTTYASAVNLPPTPSMNIVLPGEQVPVSGGPALAMVIQVSTGTVDPLPSDFEVDLSGVDWADPAGDGFASNVGIVVMGPPFTVSAMLIDFAYVGNENNPPPGFYGYLDFDFVMTQPYHELGVPWNSSAGASLLAIGGTVIVIGGAVSQIGGS